MSTQRSINRVTELAGVNYIQRVVIAHNCIFQSIAMENDQGNDCYIEFITGNVATSFCVFAQIKSGQSYKTATGYKIQTDRHHLEYWDNALNPVVGIIYDDQLDKAFWINISAYLKENREVLNYNSHTIHVSIYKEFSIDTFQDFKSYFCGYISEYKSYENYGRSLEQFASFERPHMCYEGVKSLYSNHRDKKATWLYLISNFGNITESGIHRNLLGLISNNLDNPHIFWHGGNMKYLPAPGIKEYIPQLINRYFGSKEIKYCIPFMRDGIVKGSFPFLVYMILDLAQGVDRALLQMVFEEDVSSSERSFLFWLFVHFAQKKSVADCLAMIERYLKSFPNDGDNYIIEGVRDTLIDQGFIDIG